MTVRIRLLFVNTDGISGPDGPVLVPRLPTIGEKMEATGGDAGKVPNGTVTHVIDHATASDIPQIVLDQLYPTGFDGLPVVICRIPDGWMPPEHTVH